MYRFSYSVAGNDGYFDRHVQEVGDLESFGPHGVRLPRPLRRFEFVAPDPVYGDACFPTIRPLGGRTHVKSGEGRSLKAILSDRRSNTKGRHNPPIEHFVER